MHAWPEILHEDYQAAVIRIATLTEAKVHHLLFASIELIPTEIPRPPSDIKPSKKNAGDLTATVGVSTVSVDEGLSWYEGALSGTLKIPAADRDIPIDVLKLAPEPTLGRLLLDNELPFAQHWHGGLRVNRLVPMSALQVPVADICVDREDSRQIKLRGWLADRLGFDLLAYDDLVGGLAVLAPNPVARGVATYIKETREDGSELLGIKAALRRGHEPDTLHVRLREERTGGTAIFECSLDAFGMAELEIPEQCEQTGLQVVCEKRGVLSLEPPAFFFRSVQVTSRTVHVAGEIEVPSHKRGDASTKHSLTTLQADRLPPSPPQAISAPQRLRVLQARRAARTGRMRPDGFLQRHDENEHIFFENRTEAVRFVQRLVQNARREVIFVDPYFNHIDVREFALLQQYLDVTVSILTGREALRAIRTEADGSATVLGDEFVADLSKLEAELQPMKRALPDVRVMGDAARKYHDRFLLADDAIWHIGHSFNQIGHNEVSVAVRIPRPERITALIHEDLARAATLVDAWPAIKALRSLGVDGGSPPPILDDESQTLPGAP